MHNLGGSFMPKGAPRKGKPQELQMPELPQVQKPMEFMKPQNDNFGAENINYDPLARSYNALRAAVRRRKV
jgi:hypothetical protein